MEFRAQADRGQDDAAHSRSPDNQSEGMSYWRWLVFVAMARVEVQEDVYLRLLNAKTIRRGVHVEVYTKRGSADPSRSVGQGWRLALDGRSAPKWLVSWLRRIGGRRPHG